MPTYRTSLTVVVACFLVAGFAHAESTYGGMLNKGAGAGERRGYITVEESVGTMPALRQSTRLDLGRATLSPPLPVQVEPSLPPTSVAEGPLPTSSQTASRSTLAVADKATPADMALLRQSPGELLPATRRTSQDVSQVSARVVELVQDGMLRAELAADILAKLNGLPAEAGTLRPAVVESRGDAVAAVPVSLASVGVAEPSISMTTPEIQVADPSQSSGVLGVAEAVSRGLTSPPAEQRSVESALMPVPEPTPALEALARPEPLMLASADSTVIPLVLAPGPAVAIVQESTRRVWTLSREDRTVRTAMERWARQVEWQLSWEFPTDFQIEFNADFDGEFIDAVAKVVEGLSGNERPLRAEFYKGNRVLRILSGR